MEHVHPIEERNWTLGEWLSRVEDRFHKHGQWKEQLEHDRKRVIRRMETFQSDKILEDLHTWWWKEINMTSLCVNVGAENKPNWL